MDHDRSGTQAADDANAIARADREEARRRRLEAGGPLDRFKAAFVGTPLGTIHTVADVFDAAIVPITFLWAAWQVTTTWPRPTGWTWFAIADFVVAVGFFLGKPHLRVQRMFMKRAIKRR